MTEVVNYYGKGSSGVGMYAINSPSIKLVLAGSADGRIADCNDVTSTGAPDIADKDVAAPSSFQGPGTDAQGNIEAAGGVASERIITIGRVAAASGVVKKRVNTGGCVVGAGGIAKERLDADGRVEWAGGVVKKSEPSTGRVVGTRGVAKKRSCASGRILVCSVGKERPRTSGRVELTRGVTRERKVTGCSIVCASSEAQKSLLPFCSVAPGIASVRRRTDRLPTL